MEKGDPSFFGSQYTSIVGSIVICRMVHYCDCEMYLSAVLYNDAVSVYRLSNVNSVDDVCQYGPATCQVLQANVA